MSSRPWSAAKSGRYHLKGAVHVTTMLADGGSSAWAGSYGRGLEARWRLCNGGRTDLFPRRESHPPHDNYRVVLKGDGHEIEIGSIRLQFDCWAWGIDTVVPMREVEAEGTGKDRADCMRRFRAAWHWFSANRARLTEFLEMKRKRP
jgi:hypothetical protein